MGYGDGGMLALYAGAVDTRIDAVGVSGYFGPREGIWEEPIDRNVFGLLEQFGDAELATLIAPRSLVIEATAGPEDTFESRGAAPSAESALTQGGLIRRLKEPEDYSKVIQGRSLFA